MTEPLRDHPDIEAIERTGSPSWYQGRPAAVCPECGREVRGEGAHLIEWPAVGSEPREVCGECFKALVHEDYSDLELAHVCRAKVRWL